jgi:hypothetical protein
MTAKEPPNSLPCSTAFVTINTSSPSPSITADFSSFVSSPYLQIPGERAQVCELPARRTCTAHRGVLRTLWSLGVVGDIIFDFILLFSLWLITSGGDMRKTGVIHILWVKPLRVLSSHQLHCPDECDCACYIANSLVFSKEWALRVEMLNLPAYPAATSTVTIQRTQVHLLHHHYFRLRLSFRRKVCLCLAETICTPAFFFSSFGAKLV